MNEADEDLLRIAAASKLNPRFQNLTGRRFCKLTVIRLGPKNAKKAKGGNRWECICDCGAIVNVRAGGLLSGGSKSCGCRRLDSNRSRRKSTTQRDHPLYVIWRHVQRRCLDLRNPAYPDYGGRGITVCRQWVESLDCFAKDMGPRPSKAHSIDRIDNDGNYEPGNCRWATPKQQSGNRRSNVLITINGTTKLAQRWSEDSGVDPGVIITRFRKGITGIALLRKGYSRRENRTRDSQKQVPRPVSAARTTV